MTLYRSISGSLPGDQSLLADQDTIFHYTSRTVAFEEILYRRTLKLGTFQRTDDPQEYSEKFSVVTASTRAGFHATMQAKCELDDILLNRTGFLSFCMNTFAGRKLTEAGYLKSRMWSQYAEHHKGICLAFSRKGLVKIFRSNFAGSAYRTFVGKVMYRDFDIRTDEKNLKEERIIAGEVEATSAALRFLYENRRELCFRKQKDYRDEREYRLAVVMTDEEQKEIGSIPIDQCLKAVILGDKTPPLYRSLFVPLRKFIDVPYFALKWDSGRYSMSRLGA